MCDCPKRKHSESCVWKQIIRGGFSAERVSIPMNDLSTARKFAARLQKRFGRYVISMEEGALTNGDWPLHEITMVRREDA